MPKAKSKNLFGAWAFLIGVILAIIFAFITSNIWIITILFIIGIIIGLFNVTSKEATGFLLAAVSLVLVSSLGKGSLLGIIFVTNLLENLMLIFVPATILVALKFIFRLARS